LAADDELIETASRFRTKVDANRAAHFAASDHLRVAHYVLGFLLIVVSAIVSGSVLQATGENPSKTLTLTAGIISMIVVVLTSVQTTFKLGERGEQHRSAAVGLGKVSKNLEVFIHRPHSDIQNAWDELLAIVDEISKVEAGAPGFLRRTYDRAQKDVMKEVGRTREAHATPA
jgi:hypothetical protein